MFSLFSLVLFPDKGRLGVQLRHIGTLFSGAAVPAAAAVAGGLDP